MKKTIFLKSLIVLTICTIFCCTPSHNIDENSIGIDEALLSTNEAVLLQAQEKLKEIIQIDVNRIEGEVTGFEISSTENIENDNIKAINIQFVTDSGLESNILLVVRKENNTGSNDCYSVTCSGCSGCGVDITDEGDGTFSYSCWEACCKMTIDDKECDQLFIH